MAAWPSRTPNANAASASGAGRPSPSSSGRSARRPGRPKPRPARWTAAVAELRQLQAEYEAWRDGLPEGLADSKTGQLLEGVCEVDLDALDVELPRGFGRD